MRELGDVRAAVKPTDTLLVVDAMTGQEAAGLIKAFNDAAEITGASLGMPEGFVSALILRWHISIVVQSVITMQGPCMVTLKQLPLLRCSNQQLWALHGTLLCLPSVAVAPALQKTGHRDRLTLKPKAGHSCRRHL